jgi:hypothetical protein
MVHAGTIADWMMLTVLLGGLATASWLVYGWVLGAPEGDPEPAGSRQQDLRRAA